jgi:hypothetical protein
MNSPIFSNIATYKAIAVEAFESMQYLIKSGRKPKEDGSGWVLQFDPMQRSFRQAMIVIVFTGMWLEALLHLLIVRDYSMEKYQEFDYKPYEEKLQLLGISDKSLLLSVERFRKARKALVHEKAHVDSTELKFAQDEAHNAYQVLLAIESSLVSQQP